MINFKDLPDTTTPINASNLNNMQSDIEGRISELEAKIDNLKGVTLWTNSNTNNDYPGQTITLSDNYDNYDFIDFLYKRQKTNNCRIVMRMKGGAGTLNLLAYNATSYKSYVRNCQFENYNKVRMSDASIYNVGVDNSMCIPVAIIGYKTGLF